MLRLSFVALLFTACVAAAPTAPQKKLVPPLPKNVTTHSEAGSKVAELSQFAAEAKAVLHEAASQNKEALDSFIGRAKVELAEEREEWGTEHNTRPGDLPLNKLMKKGLGR